MRILVDRACKKRDLITLKAYIKGLQLESQHIRNRFVKPFTGEKRHSGQLRKRSFSHIIRVHLLTYAYLMGKLYSEVEKNEPLKTNTHHISVAQEMASLILYLKPMWWTTQIPNKETIMKWFKGEHKLVQGGIVKDVKADELFR